MAKKKRIKPEPGDVFAVPLDGTRFGYGQIVERSIVVVYDLFAEAHPALDEIVANPVLLLVNTQLVDLQDGDWPLLGRANTPQVEYPIFKTYSPHGTVIVDLTGDVLREATDEEAETLPNHKSYSDGIIVRTLKAKLGLMEWQEYMDNLLYKGA